MNSEEIEIIRPFARMMANEILTEDWNLLTEKGNFISVMSGPALNDIPDIG